MTSASSAVAGPAVLQPAEQVEAIARMLRESRISVVLGSADSRMSALLACVSPCLCRRAIDRAPSGIRRDGGVIYLPERRSNVSVCDVAIHFQEWGDDPLAALGRRIDQALADRFGAPGEPEIPAAGVGWLAAKLLAACRRRNVRFLFVLDAFEVHLAAPQAAAGIATFDDELIETIRTNVLSANFLFAMDARAASAFERFRDRIIGFPEASVVLPAWRDPEGPPALRVVDRPSGRGEETPVVGPASEPVVPEPVASTPPAEAVSPGTDGSTAPSPAANGPLEQPTVVCLARAGPPLADSHAVEAPTAEASPPVCGSPVPEPTAALPEVEAAVAGATIARTPPGESPVAPPLGASTASSAPPGPLQGTATRPVSALGSTATNRSRRHLRFGLAALVTVAVAAFWIARTPTGERERIDPATAAIGERAPSDPSAPPPAVSTPLPPIRAALDLVIDPESGIDAAVANELRDRVARSAGLDVTVRAATHWADGLDAQATGGLAILRYDALRAARQSRPARRLQVVMPLYTEPVYVVARSDAPMTYVHQLEGRRLNIGPASSARGLTAARLYRDLFGADVAVNDAMHDGAESALARLFADRGVDAIVVVGSELGSLLGDQPAAWQSRVKTLRLDPAHPASRRVARSFLIAPAGVGPVDDPIGSATPALAEVTFLVAREPIDSSMAAALGDLARSVCANLPELQRTGHPKWREVQVGARLEVGWPYVSAAEDAFRSCPPSSSPATPAGPP